MKASEKVLRKMINELSGKWARLDEIHQSPIILQVFYVTTTTVDVEQSFSIYKYVLLSRHVPVSPEKKNHMLLDILNF